MVKILVHLLTKKINSDFLLQTAKKSKNAANCGMFLIHNGVVRCTSKKSVRKSTKSIKKISKLDVSFDKSRVNEAIIKTLQRKGIYYCDVYINKGRLNVGDSIMYVVIGGDIRQRVVKALESLVEIIKCSCIKEIEIE